MRLRARATQRDDGLSDQEGLVMDALTDAVQLFDELERTHPQEWPEFIDAIHRLQGLLACRVMQRLYPDAWPTYNPDETWH